MGKGKEVGCANCGALFTKGSNNSKHCSKKCNAMYNNAKKFVPRNTINTMPGEVWVEIAGFNNYFVSNLGRVKSNVTRRKNPKLSLVFYEKIQQLNRYGYPTVALFNVDGMKRKSVHRLVAEAFIPQQNGKDQVNHKDGDKTNNHVDNLEWCDGYENQSHRYAVLGHVSEKRLLSKEAVFEIILNTKVERKHLAEKYNVTINTIKKVRSGAYYKEIHDEIRSYSVERILEMGWAKLKGVDQ